jgi:nitrogen fixation/metabolism regulation signal transduction histidine kinase
VTSGDLTRSITVEAQGELEELKDNLNEMISNLRDTTQENAEQDWPRRTWPASRAHAGASATCRR